MIYLKRILFALAWLLYRSIWMVLVIPMLIVTYGIILPIYYVKNGTVYDFNDKIIDNYGQHIWDWINEFDPDE